MEDSASSSQVDSPMSPTEAAEEEDEFHELTQEEMGVLMGGDLDKDIQLKYEANRQERVKVGRVQWDELESHPTPERGGRNYSKSPSKSKSNRPSKTFEEMVKEDDAKQDKMGNKKTMEDYDFKPSSKKTRPPQNDHTLITVALVSIAVVLLAAGMMFYNTGDSLTANSLTPEKTSWEDAHKKLLSDIQHLKKEFPSQTKDTLLHILSSINSTLARQQPKQPSSLVILVPPNLSDSSFSECFTKKIAELTNNIFSQMNATISPSVFEIDSKFFEKYGQDISLIHSRINHYFGSGGRSIVVKDVEKIKEEKHLLLFHGLCDNFHAPEKRATLFFILPVPQKVFTTKKWSNERASDLSYEILDNAWKSTTNDDSRPAIISRVAASVVLLNDGDTCA